MFAVSARCGACPWRRTQSPEFKAKVVMEAIRSRTEMPEESG